jgi:hypothetical protein
MTDFDRFWEIYPRKVSKGTARKAWEQTASIRPPIDRLLKAVIVARATEQWRKDGGQYVPHPATWLRGERWEDVHEVEVDRVKDGKAWHETVQGIEARGAELGLYWSPNQETFQQFARRVKAISERENVVPIRMAV